MEEIVVAKDGDEQAKDGDEQAKDGDGQIVPKRVQVPTKVYACVGHELFLCYYYPSQAEVKEDKEEPRTTETNQEKDVNVNVSNPYFSFTYVGFLLSNHFTLVFTGVCCCD